LTILQPDRTISIIPNKKLRDTDIVNIKIEKTEKDMTNFTDLILYGRKVTETYYVYPLKWAVDTEDKHSNTVKAIKKTHDQFIDYLENEKPDWQIIDRDKFHRKYKILLTISDPTTLLELKDDFTESLEANYEKIKYAK
jgi:hypothetical protein